MIIRKLEGHASMGRSVIEQPQSTRAVNIGTGRIDTITRTPMPVTQSVRRPVPTPNVHEVNLTAVELESKPIEVKWSVDYDIIGLNIRIIAFMKGQKSRRDQIHKMIVSHEAERAKASSADEISSFNVKINNLKRQFDDLGQLTLMDYMSQSKHVLDAYKKFANNGPQVFGQKEIIDVSALCEKTGLVEEYLGIASKFYPLNITRTKSHVPTCPMCQGTILDDGHQYVCSDCQTTQNKMEIHAEPSNESESHSSKKSHYDSGWNFAEIVRQWQGDYPVVIGEAVLGAIRGHLEKYNGFNIKNATNYDILAAMKALNMGSWYKHINKIRFLLTGKKPRDISRLVPRIIRRGELFSGIYNDIKSDDRTNFIHGLHFLWISLMNESADIDMEDFCLLKSRDCELKGLDAMKRGFPILAKSNPEFRWDLHQIP